MVQTHGGMDEWRLVKRVMKVETSGRSLIGTPRYGWMNSSWNVSECCRQEGRVLLKCCDHQISVIVSSHHRDGFGFLALITRGRVSPTFTPPPARDKAFDGYCGEGIEEKRHLYEGSEDCNSCSCFSNPAQSFLAVH